MSQIIEASARIDIALDAWRSDPDRAMHHLAAALSATGDLQRALILERIRIERKGGESDMAKKTKGKPKPRPC